MATVNGTYVLPVRSTDLDIRNITAHLDPASPDLLPRPPHRPCLALALSLLLAPTGWSLKTLDLPSVVPTPRPLLSLLPLWKTLTMMMLPSLT